MFALLKTAYRDQVNRLEQKDVNTIDKKHFISLYSLARERTFTSKNIKIDFVAIDLFSFNSNRVLKSMLALLIELIISRIDKMKIESCRQDVESQTSMTSMLAKIFMSLQNLIIQRDAHTLDETSKQNLARHLQICTKAF